MFLMDKSLTLKNISIENFRGIGKEKTINFENLTVIYGENGTGKSSVINSLEYVFSGELSEFKRLGGKNSTVHTGHKFNDLRIKATFNNDEELEVKGKKFSPNNIRDNLNDYDLNGSFILNRSKLLEFIKNTEKDRYNNIVDFFGMKFINDYKTSLTRIKNNSIKELNSTNEEYDNYLKKLSLSLSDSEGLTYEESLSIFNNTLKEKDYKLIDKDSDFKKYIAELKVSKDSVLIKDKINNFNQIFNDLNISKLDSELNSILKSYEKLSSDNLKLSNYLMNSLKSSVIVLENTDKNKCPICNSKITPSEILPKIKKELDDLETQNTEFNTWKDEVNNFKKQLEYLINDLNKLNKYIDDLKELTNTDFKSIGISEFKNLKEDLNKLVKLELTPLDFSYELNNVNEDINNLKLEFEDTFDKYNDDESIPKIIDALTILNEIKNLDLKIEHLNKKVKTSEITEKLFIKTQENIITRIFSEISEDVNDFYNFIHDGDYIKDPSIEMPKARRVDILLNAFGEEKNARSFTSEGHIDTLGLVIFLAFNKRFSNLPFIVLDDVIATVDFSHKDKIARLLIEKLSDYQIIITTHNELWAKHLINVAKSNYNINKKSSILHEIIDWDIEEGPVFKKSISSKEVIKKYLSEENRDVYAAGNAARRYLEYTLKGICLANKISVPFSELYEVGALFDSAKKHCLNEVRETSIEEEHTNLWNAIEETKSYANLLSHDNLRSMDLEYNDVKQLCQSIMDLNETYKCKDHNTFLKLGKKKMYCETCNSSIDMGKPFTFKDFGEEELERSAEYIVDYLAKNDKEVDMETAKLMVPHIKKKTPTSLKNLNEWISSCRLISRTQIETIFKKDIDKIYENLEKYSDEPVTRELVMESFYNNKKRRKKLQQLNKPLTKDFILYFDKNGEFDEFKIE